MFTHSLAQPDSKQIPSSSSQSIIKAKIGTANPLKVNAVKNAFKTQLNTSIEIISADVPSGVNSQPIGLTETKQGALNRMRQCSPPKFTQQTHYAIGIENGLVPGQELNTELPGKFSDKHWYDIGIVAMTIFKHNSSFTYVTYATPLQIPNNEKEGMLPPNGTRLSISVS